MLRCTVCLKEGPVTDCFNAAVPVKLKVYLFGRYSDVNPNVNPNSDQIAVHIFNTVSLRWRKLPLVTTGRGERPLEVPSVRSGHTAVLVEDIIYIWGGNTYPFCNVLYAFDVDTHRWFKPEVSGTVPEPRFFHTAFVLEKVMYIYGGFTQLPGFTGMYKLDTTTMVWPLINTRGTPPHVDNKLHSATVIGTKMFVYGGMGGMGNVYNKVIVFDTETNSWLNTPSAPLLTGERRAHSAFVYNGEMYIYGGIDYIHTSLNDVWKVNPVTFTWKKVELKGNGLPQGFRMCCCMVGDRIILFGGYKATGTLNDDLYILDLCPTLKTLCKLIVIQYGVKQSELPHDIRWELAAMTKTQHPPEKD